jgi:hypothetical protein
MNTVRVLIACESAKIAAARIMLAYADLPGLADVGEVDNWTPDSQKLIRTIDGVVTEYLLTELRVPLETAIALESLFDPKPEDRATWNNRIDEQRVKAATIRAIRAKAPEDRTPEEKVLLREARKDLPGQLPSIQQFRAAARACFVWTRRPDDERSLTKWFQAPGRVDQGWEWITAPISNPPGVQL